MSVFRDAADTLAGKLTAAGVPATIDPAALAPFVLVDLVYPTGPVGVGGWRASCAVKLVATPPADLAARSWLEDTMETVVRTLGMPPAPATPGTVTITGKDCPAVTFTYPLELTNPDC